MSHKLDKNNPKLNYPPGCKEITEELNNDELVKRLKLLMHAFHDMVQDENHTYKELAIHLASEYFLNHNSKDVRLLIACCIADILRVFVPEPPYTDSEQLKEIFLFLIEQLKGLKNTEADSFKRYFYLLQNLAWVKSFNISLELPDSGEILLKLFKTTFELISTKHSSKVSVMILDMLCPMVSEADHLPQEVLDIFLGYIIEPFKSQNKPAFELARDLIKRTSSALEPYIQLFLYNCLLQTTKNSTPSLTLNTSSIKSSLATHAYDLIHELYLISPSLLTKVLPQLEFSIKSNDDSSRLNSTRLLTKLFSLPDSDLAVQHKQLWVTFLGRCNDRDLGIRRLFTQACQEIINNHPELVTDDATGSGLSSQLRQRQHDSDENVRLDVVKAIVGAAKHDLKNVTDDLLECVKERTLDKKFKVRREALIGLGEIYKKYNQTPAFLARVGWIRNKIMHAYYQVFLDDKILVERILNTSLVPYTAEPDQRMFQLYKLYANLDEYAVRTLHEIFKIQSTFRGVIRGVLELMQKQLDDPAPDPSISQSIKTKIVALSKILPESDKCLQHLGKFFKMIIDSKLKTSLLALVTNNCTCTKAIQYVKEIIRKLGSPSPQNHLYTTVKQLLERVAPLLIDQFSIKSLIVMVEEIITSRTSAHMEMGLDASNGLKLLLLLSQMYPVCFQDDQVLKSLIRFLENEEDLVVDLSMQIMANVGVSLETTHTDVHNTLLPILERMVVDGNRKQSKHSLRCINSICKEKNQIFERLFEKLLNSLSYDNENLVTCIVAIGHLTLLSPSQFVTSTESTITKFIFPQILIIDRVKGKESKEDWYEEKKVSEEVLIKVESLKMIMRWLLALRKSSSKIFLSIMRMLYNMILCEGDLMENGMINNPEMARLRLQAGLCMLRLAQEPLYAEAIKLKQFETMALLTNDPCLKVREIFVNKLHKGLVTFKLPLQYLAILCLGALDPLKSRRNLVKELLVTNVSKRREYIKQNPQCVNTPSIFSILPDYVLPYAIHQLAHDPDFTSHDNFNALKHTKDCLIFLLDSLLTKNEMVSLSFYNKMIDYIKSATDAQEPESEKANNKIYAICDLCSALLLSKVHYLPSNNFSVEPLLPVKLYKPPPKNLKNTKEYITPEILAKLTKIPHNLKKLPLLNTTLKPNHKKSDDEEEEDEDEEEVEMGGNKENEEDEEGDIESLKSVSSHNSEKKKKNTKLRMARGNSKLEKNNKTLNSSFNQSNNENDNINSSFDRLSDNQSLNDKTKNQKTPNQKNSSCLNDTFSNKGLRRSLRSNDKNKNKEKEDEDDEGGCQVEEDSEIDFDDEKKIEEEKEKRKKYIDVENKGKKDEDLEEDSEESSDKKTTKKSEKEKNNNIERGRQTRSNNKNPIQTTDSSDNEESKEEESYEEDEMGDDQEEKERMSNKEDTSIKDESEQEENKTEEEKRNRFSRRTSKRKMSPSSQGSSSSKKLKTPCKQEVKKSTKLTKTSSGSTSRTPSQTSKVSKTSVQSKITTRGQQSAFKVKLKNQQKNK